MGCGAGLLVCASIAGHTIAAASSQHANFFETFISFMGSPPQEFFKPTLRLGSRSKRQKLVSLMPDPCVTLYGNDDSVQWMQTLLVDPIKPDEPSKPKRHPAKS